MPKYRARIRLYLASSLYLIMLTSGCNGSNIRENSPAPTDKEGAKPVQTRPLPETQREFCEIVTRYAQECSAAELYRANPIKLAKIQQEGLAALTRVAAGKDQTLDAWVGTVNEIGTTAQTGHGTLKVTLPCGVALTTSNSEDPKSVNSSCPLEPQTKTYDEAANLETGQSVIISGKFVSSSGYGFSELNTPEATDCHIDRFEFLFMFTSFR